MYRESIGLSCGERKDPVFLGRRREPIVAEDRKGFVSEAKNGQKSIGSVSE